MSRGTQAVINTKALTHNLARVKELVGDTKVWAVIKADAYGHGAVQVAEQLTEADGFAVAENAEAKQLLNAGVSKPILLLEGCVSLEQTQEAIALGFHIMLHSQLQLDWLEQCQTHKDTQNTAQVWIKVDTGMHRLGVQPDQLDAFLQAVTELPNTQLNGVMSHFACADEADNPKNKAQLDCFNFLTKDVKDRCIANSAAIWHFSGSHFEWVRPGISLYGSSPIADLTVDSLGLKPVMTLQAPVIADRWLAEGESVGYGSSWVASAPTRVATIAFGYGDGYPRHAPNGTPLYLKGKIVPLIGRVSMDMITLDVTQIEGDILGEIAELWGENLSVDLVAEHIGTIGYELLTRVSPRVARTYV